MAPRAAHSRARIRCAHSAIAFARRTKMLTHFNNITLPRKRLFI